MGCGVSRIDANGMVLPARLRPLFISRFEEMKARKRKQPDARESTHSKKNLLQDVDEDDRVSCASKSMLVPPENGENMKGKEPQKPKDEASVKEIGIVHKDDGTVENGKEKRSIDDLHVDKKDNGDHDDHYEDSDDERMIGHEDDGDFPGSPSFRVYFEDNEENEPHDAVKDDVLFKEELEDDAISSKESSVGKELIKKERNRKSFKLPKGGQATMKNILKMNSCYNPAHSSHDRAHLLPGKPTTL